MLAASLMEAVNVAALDPRIPIAILHCADVSENHTLASMAVPPARPDNDTPPNPKFEPMTELPVEPVKG